MDKRTKLVIKKMFTGSVILKYKIFFWKSQNLSDVRCLGFMFIFLKHDRQINERTDKVHCRVTWLLKKKLTYQISMAPKSVVGKNLLPKDQNHRPVKMLLIFWKRSCAIIMVSRSVRLERLALFVDLSMLELFTRMSVRPL